MLHYEIEGGNLPVVICYPEPEQTLCMQCGSMSWMSPNMRMETNSGGVKKMFGRLLPGESIFLNEYTPQGGIGGMIAFAANFPGTIIPFALTPGSGIIVQKRAFLAMEKGLDLSVAFQKKISVGFFGGEGFVMQKLSGTGVAFVEIDGYCKEYELARGECMIVDTGYLAAMSETCSVDIQAVPGVKNVLFGGEGMFNTRITGPGKVYLQSMPLNHTALALGVGAVSSGSDSKGLNIKFGD